MDPQEELEWRARIEGKVDKLFGIVTDIRITCARNDCDPKDAAPPTTTTTTTTTGDSAGINGREKFLISMLTLAVAVIGILVGKVL